MRAPSSVDAWYLLARCAIAAVSSSPNRRRAAGASVSWAHDELDLGALGRYGRGAMLVTGVDRSVLEELAGTLQLNIAAADLPDDVGGLRIRQPRGAGSAR